MNARRWYRRCWIMAALGAVISVTDIVTPGGASVHGQLAASVLLIGAATIAHMTRNAP